MMVYISYDGDTIGQMVGRARLADDVEKVRRVNQRIEQGNEIWRSWALRVGGSVIEIGGDEGALEIPADHLGELEDIRHQYGEKVGATVSVGIGLKLSDASKALLAAKLQGKDRVVFYTKDCEDIIQRAHQEENTEAEKLADEYLMKVAPGEFVGFQRPSAATVDRPMHVQGDHEEGQVAQDVFADVSPPEATHAAKDFERQLHEEAWKAEEEERVAEQQRNSNLEQIKRQVLQALHAIKDQAPVLEQVKHVAPKAYQAMLGLTQSVVAMSRELTAEPMRKSEKHDKVEKLIAKVREHHAATNKDGTGEINYDHCSKGHCYEQVEAIYHLLGGDGSGWEPYHLFYGEFGPHWFLRHISGRVCDPMAHLHQESLPYDKGRPSKFLSDLPSKGAQAVLDAILAANEMPTMNREDLGKDELEKNKLPMPKAHAHHHVVLPPGSVVDNKVKVQHSDGKTSWKQVGAGMIQSQDPNGHPTSSRNPGGK